MALDQILPKISIVTPSFNQGKFLEKTILSVVEQGYPNLEYIIIDGGSTDESVEIIRRYEQHLAYWVSEPDRGQSHAINKGFERATGEIFGWLNSDDWYHPGALQAVAEAFAANPEAGAVVGAGEMVDEEGRQVIYKLPGKVDLGFLYHWPNDFFWQPSTFFTVKAWQSCGPLNEDLHFAMDLDLWLRIAKRHLFTVIPTMLSVSLKHGEAKTSSQDHLCITESALAIFRHGGEREAKESLNKYLGYLKSVEIDLRWQIDSRQEQLEYLQRLSSERAEHITSQNSHISEQNKHINELMRIIDSLHNSLSWKITAPIRFLMDKLFNH